MTTMGKILVILNLVAAMAVAAFLLFDFSTRMNWKFAYDELVKENKALVASNDTYKNEQKPMRDKVVSSDRSMETILITARAKLGEMEATLKQTQDSLQAQKELAAAHLENLERKVQENKRLQDEVVMLNKVVKDRDQEVLTARQESARFRNEAVRFENEMKAALARSSSMAQLLREKDQALAKEQAKGQGGATAATPSVRNPNFENPPPVFVKGLVQKVEKEGLVLITIGSDAGLTLDHTLEVYRTSPTPTYLGRLRVLETNAHSAVARLVPTGASRTPTLQVGDEVSSKLQSR